MSIRKPYKLATKITCLILCLFNIVLVQATNISQVERNALMALYNATDGINWTNNSGGWAESGLVDGSECSWHGVSCAIDIQGITHVSFLILAFNNLNGFIPLEIGNLTNLTSLSLNFNQLSGSIPSEIGNLTNLINLNLSSNQLSESIPPEIENLTNLIYLWLQSNQLSGSIPSEIGNLTALTDLQLYSNQLSGSIPPEIGGLTNLTWLSLSFNQLSGSIPTEMGDLTNLTWLSLGSNQISGSIPAEIWNLTALTDLQLYSNQLSGSIPPEIRNLTALTNLIFFSNQLSGFIPPDIQDLTNLSNFQIHTNGCIKTLGLSLYNYVSNFDSAWVSCNSPDVFVFTEHTGVNFGSTNSSNIITISGLVGSTSISVSNGFLKINGIEINPTETTIVSNGDDIQVFHDSGLTYDITVISVVTIGDLVISFSSTTFSDEGFCFPIQTPEKKVVMICL